MACSAEMTPVPAAAVISPTLCPAAAPTTWKASEGCGKISSARDQPGGDQQRLRDGGVADRLRVGLGAVVHQVQAGAGGQPAQPVLEVRQLEPGREESGRLGALTGSDDDQHLPSLSDAADPRRCGARTKVGRVFVGSYKDGVGRRASASRPRASAIRRVEGLPRVRRARTRRPR